MTVKGVGRATAWREIDEWGGGTGWIAYPDELMRRASHALDGEEGQYLVDPVDCDGLDEFLAERGPVAGVVVLLSRHKRDAAALARRHDVPVYVPDFMDGVARSLDAPVERVHRELPDSEYGVHKLVDNRFWREAILYGDETETLVVPEAVGTNAFSTTGDERLGVQPALRLTPPKKLGRLTPRRILVGHGQGIFENAAEELRDALSGSRRRAPRLYVQTLEELLS